ncbi:MFS transporter [Cordyceps javanica]|uniref:MFS transporter n=1 Tax=Cordyceps javanica TaxID=43265 RepID=A0A545VRX6_9HYPO|nr:MFS transporter [Cordyceps javanica]TQW04482.1 MFS transporter [Cordyceps javanica]
MVKLQPKLLLSWLRLDWHTAQLTVKTSIPPAVLVCAIQSDTWISYFGQNAYLAPIAAASVMAGFPQGMLIDFNVKQTIGYVVAYCWALLAGWCGLQARKHTTRSPEELAAYNSSAEAVVAVMLAFGMWVTFTVKSAFPSWNIQTSVAAILGIAMIPALARLPTMHSIIKEATNAKSVEQLEAALQQLGNEVAKANGHVDHAAREFSWGAYSQSELDAVCSLLVQLVPPASGLSLVADMMQRETDVSGVPSYQEQMVTNPEVAIEPAKQSQDDWHHTETEIQGQLIKMAEMITAGAKHAKLRLRQIQKRSWARGHSEKPADQESHEDVSPGGSRLVQHYCDMFREDGDETLSRREVLHRYVQHRPKVGTIGPLSSDKHADILRYFALLHSQTILTALGRKLLRLIVYLDDRHGRPRRFVPPNFLSLSYWARYFSCDLANNLRRDVQNKDGGPKVELDPVFHKPRNPDHLPAANTMEAVGDFIRKINSVLRTEHAAYGLRGACAVMTIAIIGFLHDSQDFYFAQRLLWALFAILLSMGRTSGSSTFLLMGRLLGTTASMVASYIIWYIVDQRTPGVLVFMWLWFMVISFLTVRFPALFSIWFVALIAAIVMIGIELQTMQIGEEAVKQSGQAVYPPYVIFPYRLAIVALGVITSYIWTIFPYPISEHSELRESTAQVLYELSRYYMCIQQTVFARLHRDIGDADDASSPSSRLQSALRRLFLKYRGLSADARRSFQFMDWEFSLGGRFPKKAYGEILSILDRSGSYMALTSYLSKESKSPDVIAACWAESGTGIPNIDLTPHGIASRIIILRSALGGGHPLPPGLHQLRMSNPLQFSGSKSSEDYEFAIAALIHNVHWYFIHDVNRLTERSREFDRKFKQRAYNTSLHL